MRLMSAAHNINLLRLKEVFCLSIPNTKEEQIVHVHHFMMVLLVAKNEEN